MARTPKPPKAQPNTRVTETGETVLTCAFGTDWLDHFQPPLGTGKGCPLCDGYRC